MKYGFDFLEPSKPEFPNWNFVLAVIIVTLLAVAIFKGMARAEMQPSYTNEQIAQAIFRAENSVKYPYGIKSINTYGNKEYARKICLNSIKNARKRWIKAGMPEDFISYIGRRYSPPNINPNWVRLVNYFLMRG